MIGRCLTSLTSGLSPGELDIVVVANACSDDTANIASTYPGVRVLETSTAGKAHALNMADEVLAVFPRIYLDADVKLAGADALLLISYLTTKKILAAAPSLDWSAEGVSPICRAYYRAWTRRPYVADRMIGSGVYALSESGRSRFGRFPEIISDDGYVLSLFGYDERATVPNCRFTIYPPSDFRSLLRVKTRAQIGVYQLSARGRIFGRGTNFPRKQARRHLIPIVADPAAWVVLGVVRVAVRIAAFYRLRAGKTGWLRDESSRLRGQPD